MRRGDKHVLSAMVTAMAIAIVSGCSSPSPSTPVSSSTATLTSAEAPLSTATLIAPDAGSGDPKAAQAALGDPTVLAQLRSLALHVSSHAGVSSPRTMEAVVAFDHGAAEKVLCSAIISDHTPVFVIKLTGGPFTAQSHPPGVPAPQGDFLTLTVDAATREITDIGYVNVEPDLSQLGLVKVNL